METSSTCGPIATYYKISNSPTITLTFQMSTADSRSTTGSKPAIAFFNIDHNEKGARIRYLTKGTTLEISPLKGESESDTRFAWRQFTVGDAGSRVVEEDTIPRRRATIVADTNAATWAIMNVSEKVSLRTCHSGALSQYHGTDENGNAVWTMPFGQ